MVLQIPGARSLKDRRQVVKSFKERARARLPVSISEVGDVERHQVATLGAVTVARDSAYCVSVISQLTELASSLPDGVLADVRTEVLSFGEGGEGIRGGIESRAEGSRSNPPGDFADLAEKWGQK
ncbi:MAG: DUF503 domain-containing protein [Polyangiaceae bacterium]|nr:DUF503 domain-containing protein [Polyangiaceae bacterium]MBK8997199.1 DUF503 domain-containing protein [Myxococcales bacterium]MCL4749373.1 DUF503 family protein [Myxococcales bacterium]